MRLFRTDIQDQLAQINCIMQDIEDNIEAVQSVDKIVYREIMGSYAAKLSLMQQQGMDTEGLKHEEHFKIFFPQIPHKIGELASKIEIASDVRLQKVFLINKPAFLQGKSSLKESNNTKIYKNREQCHPSNKILNEINDLGYSFEESSIESRVKVREEENTMMTGNFGEGAGRPCKKPK